MGNYEGSKKRTVQRKNYAPGMHGQKGSFGKPSEFGKQLREKQKAKRIFNISEKQFQNYYKKAEKQKGNTGEILMKLLEMRLDNVLYRAGFASTRRQSRQIASHGLIQLNNKRVNIPSIQMKMGDLFSVREKSRKSSLFIDGGKKKNIIPKWIKVDFSSWSGQIIAEPDFDDFEKIIEVQSIVEFYSK